MASQRQAVLKKAILDLHTQQQTEQNLQETQGQFKLFLFGLEGLGISSCHVLLLASKTQTFAGFEQVQNAEFVAAFQPGLYAHSWRRGLGATVFRHPWNTSEIPSGKSLVLRLMSDWVARICDNHSLQGIAVNCKLRTGRQSRAAGPGSTPIKRRRTGK